MNKEVIRLLKSLASKNESEWDGFMQGRIKLAREILDMLGIDHG